MGVRSGESETLLRSKRDATFGSSEILLRLNVRVPAGRAGRWNHFHRAALGGCLVHVRIDSCGRADHAFGLGKLIGERSPGLLADGRRIASGAWWTSRARMLRALRNSGLCRRHRATRAQHDNRECEPHIRHPCVCPHGRKRRETRDVPAICVREQVFGGTSWRYKRQAHALTHADRVGDAARPQRRVSDVLPTIVRRSFPSNPFRATLHRRYCAIAVRRRRRPASRPRRGH